MTKHRLNVTIEDDDFWREWNSTVSWGLRQHLIIATMRMITSCLNNSPHKGLMLGAMISGHYKLVIDHEKVALSSRGAGGDSPILGPEDGQGTERAQTG